MKYFVYKNHHIVSEFDEEQWCKQTLYSIFGCELSEDEINLLYDTHRYVTWGDINDEYAIILSRR